MCVCVCVCVQKKVEDDDSEKYSEKYSGAVLIDGSSILSRRDVRYTHTQTNSLYLYSFLPLTLPPPPPPPPAQSDCIDMNQLKYWVELLPTDNITFLVDCHHSHVVSYGKQRLVSGLQWYTVVHNGLQWYTVVQSGLWWYIIVLLCHLSLIILAIRG